MFAKKGVDIEGNKFTASSPIRQASLPDKVIIPLKQHIGAQAKPCVKVGDSVSTYQVIGRASGLISADVHASVSGKVIDISKHYIPSGERVDCIVISSDKKDTKKPMQKLDPDKTPKDKLLARIAASGIVGLGGACFPTHVKLQPKKNIDIFILNGCECEPYLTCDHQNMLEFADEIVLGLKIMMKVSGAKKAIIGIEENKPDAIKKMTHQTWHDNNIEVRSIKTRYPAGAEKILIKELTGKVVPAGMLPAEIGFIVNNVSTAKAVYDAVYEGIPLVEKTVTITGDVKQPRNLSVRLGASFKDLLNDVHGYNKAPKQIIASGPMMGQAQYTDDFPIIKGTSGVIVFNRFEKIEINPCFRCGKCVDACPYNLMPSKIALLSENQKFDLAEKANAMDCVECGACAYVCPTRRPLVQLIKVAKKEICKSKDEEISCIGKPSSKK